MSDDELRVLRAALAARIESCWNQLDDVVEELTELHRLPLDSILDRVRKAGEKERRASGRA
jgi:hypothetical protein